MGISLLPFCHFDLEESDYLIHRAAMADTLAAADAEICINQANTKVLEFVMCGLGVVSTRSEVGGKIYTV